MKKLSGISILCALLLSGYAALAGEPLPPPTAQPQPTPQPVVQPAAAPAQPAAVQPAPQQSSLTTAAPVAAPQPVPQPVEIVPVQPPKLFIVTTLTDYAGLARRIAGDLADVEALVPGVQDPSSVTPKPWFSETLTRAQLLITTGGDAEPWLRPVIRRAGCKRFYPGQQAVVAVSDGIKGRIGGNYVYMTSPVYARQAAKNIAAGLQRIDNDHAATYAANLAAFISELDVKLFGDQLVKMMDGDNLATLAGAGELIPFLENHQYNGVKLIDLLGGWMKRFMPFRGVEIVTYAPTWGYFARVFGLNVAATLEPFGVMSPTASHNRKVELQMQQRGIRYILTEEYYCPCDELNMDALPLVAVVKVPMHLEGEQGLDDYFALVERWFWGFENAKPASLLKVQPAPLKPAVQPAPAAPVAPAAPAPVQQQPVQKPAPAPAQPVQPVQPLQPAPPPQ